MTHSRKLLILLSVFFLVYSLPAGAVNLWGDATVSVQRLEYDQAGLRNQSAGFRSMRSNLHFYHSVTPSLNTYVETHLNSRDDMTLNQVYATYTSYSDILAIKLGRFELDYGMYDLFRTDNAQARDNSFVGNTLVDPHSTDNGVQATLFSERFYVRGALTTGTDTPGFTRNRAFGKTFKFLHKPTPALKWSLSYYVSDQSLSSETGHFFVKPADEPYSGLGTDTRTSTHVTSSGSGQELQSFQFGMNYDINPRWRTYVILGRLKDDTGVLKNTLDYANGALVRSVSPVTEVGLQIGLASYERIEGQITGVGVKRFQLAITRKLAKKTEFTVEYVDQQVDDSLRSLVTRRRPVGFSGFTAQLYVGF
ncbi:MAG: hypothetical protein ABEH89_00415 [bacterium]